MKRFLVATVLDIAAFAVIYRFVSDWKLQLGLLVVSAIIVEFLTKLIFKELS